MLGPRRIRISEKFRIPGSVGFVDLISGFVVFGYLDSDIRLYILLSADIRIRIRKNIFFVKILKFKK